MAGVTGAGLASTLAGLAAEAGGTHVRTSGGSTTWSRGDATFAVLRGASIELRLDAAVAAAALRTPDTARSERGPEWVRYAPSTLEGHDLDRLTAWFGLAHKRAGQAATRAPTARAPA